MKAFARRVVHITLFLSSACAYENDETYFKDIPLVEHDITFTLSKYDQADTIFLSGPERFSFQVGINPGKIERVVISIDGEEQLVTQGGSISYPFDEELMTEGVFQMTVELTAAPGTGSLAEMTGSERIVVRRNWLIKVEV